ncbi:hypothetical protein LDENG_00217870 [Lucifuga dentata]|nr:hypothetical protein LDENG_00217870 [Lucifuga dentata]
MHPRCPRTSQRTSTLTWTTQRPRKRPSPSNPSSGSSRRRSVMRSPSEPHVALPLCVETAGWHNDSGVTFACKQIHTCTNSRGCGGVGGECNSLLII